MNIILSVTYFTLIDNPLIRLNFHNQEIDQICELNWFFNNCQYGTTLSSVISYFLNICNPGITTNTIMFQIWLLLLIENILRNPTAIYMYNAADQWFIIMC